MGLVVVALTLTNLARSTDIAGLREVYDGTMLPGVEVATFSHPEKLLPVRVVPRGKSSQPLPKALKPFPSIHFDVRGHHYFVRLLGDGPGGRDPRAEERRDRT